MKNVHLPTTYVRVDLNAIAHNVRALKSRVGPRVMLMAVVKANAYGHGIVETARAALANGADWLAVARVCEGVQLREAGVRAPILILGYHAPSEAEAVVQFGLTATVNSIKMAEALAAHARRLDARVRVHVKVDTGMGRFGVLPEEALAFWRAMTAMPRFDVEGLWTHFATADERDKTYARRQLRNFLEVARAIEEAGYAIPMRHVANSAALLDLEETHLDAVRPGIAIYGLRPSHEVEPSIPLQPALSLISHVGRVRVLPAGSGIGYGRTFITPRPMRVALVPVGYGDGYHRLLSNRGEALIHGRRARILGRVCMDNIVLDVDHIPEATEGDEVVLIGRQGEAQITAEEVAGWAETINYEVTTALLPRAPRIYEEA